MGLKRAFGIASLSVIGGMPIIAACEESDTPTVAASDAATESSTPELDAANASDVSDAALTCDTLPGSYGSKSCNDCMKTTCCAVITSCEADPACKALQKCTLDCIQGPDAGACYNQKCLVEHAAGKQIWDQVYACWYDDPPKCGVSCT